MLLGPDGTRPTVGRSPITPQNAAGILREPARSEPDANGNIPDARPAAPPPVDPPADKFVSQGLSVAPKTSLKVLPPVANSGLLVLPIMTAPAFFNRDTIISSLFGTLSANKEDP